MINSKKTTQSSTGDDAPQYSAPGTQNFAMGKDACILVAGAAGMVGSAIVRRLLELGYTNLVGTYHSRLPGGECFGSDTDDESLPMGLRLVPVDLTRQDEVERLFQTVAPDHVFLAAAKVGGIHANNTYPAQFIYENLAIQSHIIHAAYQGRVKRLLFLGSSCIYPKLAPQPMQEAHLLSGYLEPTNEAYAIAKIAGIKMCEAYNRQYGTRFMAVMPTNLYGPNDNFNLENSHVLPALLRKFHIAKLAQEGHWDSIQQDEATFGPIPDDIKSSLGIPQQKTDSSVTQHSAPSTRQLAVTLWGTGSPRREFLHVDDMADASVFVMNLDDQTADEHLLRHPQSCFVNVGSGVDGTIRELAELIRDVVGFKGELKFDTAKPDGTPQKLLDISKLKTLGWTPRVSLSQGVQDVYSWYICSYLNFAPKI